MLLFFLAAALNPKPRMPSSVDIPVARSVIRWGPAPDEVLRPEVPVPLHHRRVQGILGRPQLRVQGVWGLVVRVSGRAFSDLHGLTVCL